MKRIFAHRIIYNGREYVNHVAELDEATGEVSLYPFEHEIHSTRFISGTVMLSVMHLPDKPVSFSIYECDSNSKML